LFTGAKVGHLSLLPHGRQCPNSSSACTPIDCTLFGECAQVCPAEIPITVGRRLRPAPHGCRPASHPPFSRSYCRHPPTRCRSCRDSKRFWCFAAPFSVTGQPAISLPIGRTAGRRPARRRARARGPAAARGRTARDRRAVERSPSTADLTRLRVCRAVQITDVKLIIMATPPARAATSHSRQDTQGLQRITTLWVVIGPVIVGFRCAPIELAISNPR
jgi:hypothetical protein